ncbi:Hypothetical protein A7982_10911 [Minicystis rosea]|nr:Hypothetical protein A7982_10911 [Minicystis rosea]
MTWLCRLLLLLLPEQETQGSCLKCHPRPWSHRDDDDAASTIVLQPPITISNLVSMKAWDDPSSGSFSTGLLPQRHGVMWQPARSLQFEEVPARRSPAPVRRDSPLHDDLRPAALQDSLLHDDPPPAALQDSSCTTISRA